MPYSKQTHCANGHELTPDNVYVATRSNGRTYRQCRTCHREHDARQRAQMTLEERRERRKSFPSTAKSKHYQRKYKYGMTEEELRHVLDLQGGGCGICARPLDVDAEDKVSKPAVDHDHETGTTRAVLCQNCNTGLGMFGDDVRTLRMALAYLMMHKEGVA